jgi:bifunctional DNA-binding transcriptional regulator/antitoxin component of YhaV-PrlF toxin-antitoxin module
MTSLLARVGGAALVLPVLFAVAGCDLAMADLKAKETAEWRKTYQLQPGGRVEIVNVNGRIAVEPSDGNTLEVVALKSARGSTPEGAKEALGRVEIREEASPNAVRIETKVERGASSFFNHGGVEVAYTVRVPAGADMRFTTVNGGINVTRVDGRLDVETVNGGIEVREVTAAAFEASTVNGGIEADLARVPERGAKLECTNGGITLRLPRDAKADISARVANGGIDADGLPVDATEKSRRRFEGRLNGGGPRIEIEGTNGGIQISAR